MGARPSPIVRARTFGDMTRPVTALALLLLLTLLALAVRAEYVGYVSSDRYYGYKRVGYNSRYGTPNYSIQLSGDKNAAPSVPSADFSAPAPGPSSLSSGGNVVYSYTDIRH